MIETAWTLGDVDAIAALASVDGLFIGPFDLSLARGRGAFRYSAEDEADFRRVAKACRRHNKLLGFPAANPGAFALARAEGAAYVTLSDDLTVLLAGLRPAPPASVSRDERSDDDDAYVCSHCLASTTAHAHYRN